MKIRTKISIAVLFFTGVFTSCMEDKGNYDYNWLPEMGIQVASDSLIVSRGNALTVTPVFVDLQNDEKPIEVNYDDYEYVWYCLPYGEINVSKRVFISDKYNIDEPIYLPIQSNYHLMRLMAQHKQTRQIYTAQFRLRVIGRFESTYAFLTEDASRNVELEFYGWDAAGNVIHDKDNLALVEFPYTEGGANGIGFDKYANRIYIATGSGMGWLNSPSFDFDPQTNKLSELMFPQTVETFTAMIRKGKTGAAATARDFYMFTEAGDLHVLNNMGLHPSISLIGTAPISLAPMVASFDAQRCPLFWDQTNKQIVWGSMYYMGTTAMSRNLFVLNHAIPNKLSECIHMGGSEDRPMIAVVKDVDGTYWRLDYSPLLMGGSDGYAPREIREPKRLIGTADLGKVDHWLTTIDKGYFYAVTNNTLYTYVETQTGGTADPGWTLVNITDADNATVTIEDPISFVLSEYNGSENNLNSCFYVVTYSAAKGSTVYILNATDTGVNVKLLNKITGLGNVKKMCYWWG